MRRLIAYGLAPFDAIVDESVITALEGLRPHADRLIVIAPRGFRGEAPSRQALDAAADAVWPTADGPGAASGFAALRARLGEAGLAEFDELVWVDDSVIGPIGDIESALLPMPNGTRVETLVAPDLGDGPERADLVWLRVQREAFADPRFWEVVRTSAAGFREFTSALVDAGLEVRPRFERASDGEVFVVRDSLPRLLDAGLPFVPWRALTIDPLVADRWAIVPRETYDRILDDGYPVSSLWSRLLRTERPRDWYTNLAMAEVVPATAVANGPVDLRIAVLIHTFYTDMAPELLDRAANLPGEVRVVLTTDSAEKQTELRELVAGDDRFAEVDVRVVTSNRGRDISAFLVDCRDVLQDPSVDLIVKLHSKRSVQDPGSVSSWFRRHLFENLLAAPGYARNVIELFVQEPRLGIVFPPTIHMGLPTMGHAWGDNLKPARALAPRLGIRIPFDRSTPLSPYGSMFIARREAIAPLLDGGFMVDEFPDHHEYKDGSLAHVLERLVSYVVFSRGFYAKTVQTPSLAAISGSVLEFGRQATGAHLPAHPLHQVAVFEGEGEFWPIRDALLKHLRAALHRRAPIVGRLIGSVLRIVRRLRGRR